MGRNREDFLGIEILKASFDITKHSVQNLEDFGSLLQLILTHWVLFYLWEFWFSTGKSKGAMHHRMILSCQLTETNIAYAK